MPYKRKGKFIFHYKDGAWRLKQRAKTIVNAKKIMRLLNMLEH